MKGWIKDIAIACIAAVLIMQFVKPTIVSGSSMQPTLDSNNYIFLSKQAYTFGEPKRGDIVVFHTDFVTAEGKEELFIKRIIGLPGDVVTISQGQVYVNELPLEEPYIAGVETAGDINELKVPEECLFVMGDNRGASKDSRFEDVGCIPIKEVVGKAFFRLYPFSEIGLI